MSRIKIKMNDLNKSIMARRVKGGRTDTPLDKREYTTPLVKDSIGTAREILDFFKGDYANIMCFDNTGKAVEQTVSFN